jgi:integrase
MEESLTKQYAIRQAEFPDCPFVFFWHTADCKKGLTQRGGKLRAPGTQLKGFRDEWTDAVKDAGFPELLIHDLRRSAVSNMIQEFGMDEDDAMIISGHKTRAMLTRYNIRKPGKILKIGTALQDGFQKMRDKARAVTEGAATADTTPAS